MPSVIIAPHEYVAAAPRRALRRSPERRAVFVHVDVGTQNMGGAPYNAYRCRVPVFTVAHSRIRWR